MSHQPILLHLEMYNDKEVEYAQNSVSLYVTKQGKCDCENIDFYSFSNCQLWWKTLNAPVSLWWKRGCFWTALFDFIHCFSVGGLFGWIEHAFSPPLVAPPLAASLVIPRMFSAWPFLRTTARLCLAPETRPSSCGTPWESASTQSRCVTVHLLVGWLLPMVVI